MLAQINDDSPCTVDPFTVEVGYFLGKRLALIWGSSCSKINRTLESIELSHTITPSLERRKTPPMIFLFISSS